MIAYKWLWLAVISWFSTAKLMRSTFLGISLHLRQIHQFGAAATGGGWNPPWGRLLDQMEEEAGIPFSSLQQ